MRVEILQASSSSLPLADRSADIVFCHQTLASSRRAGSGAAGIPALLKPGGMLLLAKSTRAYIHSWIIRLLFRHPMHVQRTAAQYLAMIRDAGFTVDDAAVSYPYLWWSRSDLGIAERLFGVTPPRIAKRR